MCMLYAWLENDYNNCVGVVILKRPVTMISNQWLDLPLDVLCGKLADWGYDGIELSEGHFDPARAAADETYAKSVIGGIQKYGLCCRAVSGHLSGQCVGDLYDPRLDAFAPERLRGRPEAIRQWAVENMKTLARAAKNMGISVITGFMGSPVWKYWYSFPATPQEMVHEAFDEIYRLWTPILDEFDACGVRLALEVHPTEIAFDYYTTKRLLDRFDWRPALGINFDPSHLLWQGIDPALFLRDFSGRVYHVHMKDVAVTLDGRSGILGSHLEFGDLRRGWNFRSLGHGDVDFDAIIRELNACGYSGPLSVEWEDSGMEREFGARESLEFLRKADFSPSGISFDAFMQNQ